MLMILMSIEEQFPSVQLNNDTPDWPYVTELVPTAALKQNLRWTVLPGIYDRAMVLVLLCSASEVDYLQFRL